MGLFDSLVISLKSVGKELDSVAKKGDDAADKMRRSVKAMDEFRKGGNAMKQQIGELELMLQAAAEGGNQWTVAMLANLDKVKAGEQTIEQFMRVWGDAEITTSQGVKRISELLAGLNPPSSENPIDLAIEKLYRQESTIAEVVERVKAKSDRLSQAITVLIEKLRAGEISLQFFLEQLKQAERQAGPGSDNANIAQQLGDAAIQGLL